MALNSMGLGFLFKAKDLASGSMRKLERNFKSMDDTTDATQKKFTTNTQKMGLGLGLMGAGAVGLRALGPAVTEARNFGKAIGEVSTLVDEAAFSTEEMRKITMDMAETYGADALQQAPALYQTISAGISDSVEATKLLETANKLAIGGVTDLTTSVDGLTTAVNAYASSNLTAEDAADTMFVAIKAGKTTANELARTLGRVAPTAESLGISFQELNAGLAAITTKGIRTKEAVTGLKAAMANVLKPTSDAQKEAKRLGISFDAASLRAKGLPGFLNSITTASKFNKDSLAKLFGSVEALNAIIALTAGGGKKFKEVLGQMDTRAGAADQAFGKMNKTFDAQMNRLGASTKNFKIMIGEALIPLIKALAFVITNIVKAFMALPGPVRSVIAIGFALISVIMVVGGAVIFLKAAVAALGLANFSLIGSLGKVGGAMKAFGMAVFSATKFVVTGFLSMASAAWALIVPLLPIILVIALIAAAIALVVIYFDELVDAGVWVIEKLVAGFKFLYKIWVWQIKTIWKIWKGVFNAIVKAAKWVWGIAVDVAEAIGDAFGTAADFIVGVWDSIVSALTPVFDFIKGIISSISDFIESVVEKVTWLIDKGKEAASWVGDTAGGVWDFASGTINPFSDDFLDMPGDQGGGGGGMSALMNQARAQAGGPNPALAALSASRTHAGAAKQPIIVNTKTIVDGEVVGQASQKYEADERNRSFSSNLGEDN